MAHKRVVVVAVAVIRGPVPYIFAVALSLILGVVGSVSAATLAPERVEVNYHQYSGGGIDVANPAVLVRKQLLDQYAITAGYQIDEVSGASIDVEARASEYKEERTEVAVGLEYLHEKTLLSLGVVQTDENDFEGRSIHVAISQDFFADMTTLTLGYAQAQDDITQTGVPDFAEEADRRHFRVSMSQVISQTWIANLALETITDEGYLQNPYRAVRYRDLSFPGGFTYQPELYPRTRTSRALALRLRNYLERRAAMHYGLRTYTDSWGIGAFDVEIGYVYPFADSGWEVETRLRHYRQSAADFYRDLFDFQDQTNFRARDKELSEFNSTTLGLGVRYAFKVDSMALIERASVNLFYDFMRFDYDNFLDVTENEGLPGEEPAYQFDAHVIRFFISLWY